MAWTLKRVICEAKPINPNLTYARIGATHFLSITLDAEGPAGRLSSTIPVPVRVGPQVTVPDGMDLGVDFVHEWNGSLDAPTLTPDIRVTSRGGLHASLVDGILTPMPGNQEPLLSEAARVKASSMVVIEEAKAPDAKITPAMALKIALEAGPNLGLVVVVGSDDDLEGVEVSDRSTMDHADLEAFVHAASLRARNEERTVVLFAENVRRSVPSVMRQDASLILGITKCRARGRTVPLPARR